MNNNKNVYANSRYQIFRDLNLGKVRTYVDGDDEVWFYMRDIAKILDIKNPANVIASLRFSGYGEDINLVDSTVNSRNQHGEFTYKVKETIVKETALSWICGHSRKPNAVKLTNFISKNVVPSLARYGAYIMPEDREKYMKTPEEVKKLLKALKDRDEKLDATNEYARGADGRYNELLDRYEELEKRYEDALRRLEEYENAEY